VLGCTILKPSEMAGLTEAEHRAIGNLAKLRKNSEGRRRRTS